MATFSLGVRTLTTAIATAAWEIRTTTTRRAKVMELGIFLAAATASTYAIGRPAAIGVTPGTLVFFMPEDPADIRPSVVDDMQSALSWGTGPTVPVDFFRRIAFPATIGVGVIWTFPKGWVIPISSSVVLWNVAANGAVDAYAVLDG